MAIGSKKFLSLLGSVATGGWFRKIMTLGFEFFLLQEVIEVLSTITNAVWGGTLLLWADNNPKLAMKAVQFVADEVTKQTPIAAQLAAATISQITGIGIDSGRLGAAASGSDRHAYAQVMGDEFTQVISTMLDTKLAQEDFKTRNGFAGSFANLSSYFGTNLDFQLRSLTIGTISSIFGWQSLRHLEGLHQSINWAFGFGWLSWSVLSNAMDVTVNAGVKRYYNALVKPHDLSQSQANKLRIRNVMNPDTWAQIHANAGMRDDARDWSLQLEFNQPSMGVLKTAYQHGLATDAQIDEQMLLHEYTPNGSAWQKAEIQNERKWSLQKDVLGDYLRRYRNSWTDPSAARTFMGQLGYSAEESQLAFAANAPERIYHLREAVTREHMKFLRHGWETEQEARNWLNSQGWSEEEIQLALEANRLELKAQRIPPPKFLSEGQVGSLVAGGQWDASRGLAYLVGIGYDQSDASEILGYQILQHAVSITPRRVRDACETEAHLQNLLTSALSAVNLIGVGGTIANSDYFRLVTCYAANLIPGSTPGPGPEPQRPPAPLNLTATPSGEDVVFNWQPVNGQVDYTLYRRDIGSNIFLAISVPSRLTTYTDKGRVVGQTYVYVVRSRSNGVESLDSNIVQL